MDDGILRVAENISVLRSICDKPIPPTCNQVMVPNHRDGRILRFKEELDIVNCLNYLSSYSDHPGEVTGLCLEESADRQHLIISVATNNGSSPYLEQGLRSIADILEQQDSSTEKLEILLNKVILHGKARFVRRLNYVPLAQLGTRTESTTVARLQTVMHYAAKINPELTDRKHEMFTLVEDFTRLSHKYTEPVSKGQQEASEISTLTSIARVVAKIWKRHGDLLLKAIASVPNLVMDPSARESLRIRLGHIGHIFRNIDIRPVYIEPADLSTMLNCSQTSIQQRLLNARTRCSGQTVKMGKKLLATISDVQQRVDPHIYSAQAQGRYKVHAEIQLLCYYERRPDTMFPPRVLKSSKDACFLCDMFIKTHEKFYIPKTHGRVYDLWMLPDVEALALGKKTGKELATVIEHFNAKIEELIVSSLSQTTRILVDPRESGIFSLASSTHAASEATIRQSPHTEGSDKPCTPLSTPETIVGVCPPTVDVARNEQPESTSHFTLPLAATSSDPPTVTLLQRGKFCTYTFGHVGATARFHTPKIHIELSHQQAQGLANMQPADTTYEATADITVEVTWLEVEQVSRLTPHRDGQPVDLDSDWAELTVGDGVLFTDEGLLLRKGTHVVRIRVVDAMFSG
ncbi:hypothetical protein BDW02DRAFT_628553 [Decorospora gaudefroyi]|uniref:Uncharacterized protein n=1 Tax=Decorospora gaudefroyi TaxID=184978 RepID=A0A6A5KKP4_9PLEO|nr:hypothetical protein BDW02DRAFT_628553 [Decorospora gaudefroyi]